MVLLNRKVLILTFCSIGCSIHLFHVVNEFRKFPVRTDIIYDYPEKMIVPEFDIFLYNIDLLNLTALYFKYPVKMKRQCEILMQLPNSTKSDENFIANCTKTFKSHRDYSYLITPVLSVHDVENLSITLIGNRLLQFAPRYIHKECSIKKYFNAVKTFIRFSCRENSKQIERKIGDDYLARDMGADNRFCIEHSIYHRFGVRLAHINSSINTDYFNYFEVKEEAEENVITFLRYQATVIENSEWPYQTNCRHYQKSQIFSQCLHEKISHSFPGVVQFDDVIQERQFPSNFTFEDLKYWDNETLAQIRSECLEQVKQPQCIEKTYKTQGRTYKQGYTGIRLICLENQYDFNIILKTYPQSTPTEFFIYIGSILGIWFGISIYGKLMDGFVLSTIETKISEPIITSNVGSVVDISSMIEEQETV